MLKRLISVATVVPTTGEVVSEAFDPQRSRGLSPLDASVYASVLCHLRRTISLETESCFVTRDRDFTDADMRVDLEALDCKPTSQVRRGAGVRTEPPLVDNGA